jgi:hypothetical protein
MRRGTLIGWGIFALFLLPAWAVKSAAMQSRMMWLGVVLFFAFLGAMITLITAIGPPSSKHEPGPVVKRQRSRQALVWGLSFLVAELSAIAFTHAEPGVGPVGSYGLLVSSVGANLFPVVAKYATAMQPPLSPTSLFRVQSIVSIFMLAGIPCLIARVRTSVTGPSSSRQI